MRPAGVVVLAKRPVPGSVKTRLVPPLTFAQAANVAGAALADTLDVVGAAAVPWRTLAFAGPPDGWLRPGWTHHAQVAGALDLRIAAALGSVRGPVVLVGMDTPQLTTQQLTAFDPDRYDACLGFSEDGGFWSLGLAEPQLAAAAVVGVPMSTPYTGREQYRRLRALGLRVQLLETLRDVDTVADAVAVAALATGGQFADTMRSLRPAAA